SGIFLYAEPSVVFQGLVQSLERTFPDIRIRLSGKLAESDEFDGEVGLVLIHTDVAPKLADCIDQCRTRFPDASLALMMDETHAGIPEFKTVFDRGQVQGLLPFNLKLDLWLAVIWLLLNGGDYCPSSLLRAAKTPAGRSAASRGQSKITPATAKSLTSREREILELLSQGMQNKAIADRLALSVHTVKVHVHNLIRKLRAHNRTQATAIYRNMDQG
ncbi:MAG: response regulator transcription factor, partial [Phyllobacterium sp.]